MALRAARRAAEIIGYGRENRRGKVRILAAPITAADASTDFSEEGEALAVIFPKMEHLLGENFAREAGTAEEASIINYGVRLPRVR